nr:uncharacterized protein LOC118877045 [Drosophila suzukii]
MVNSLGKQQVTAIKRREITHPVDPQSLNLHRSRAPAHCATLPHQNLNCNHTTSTTTSTTVAADSNGCSFGWSRESWRLDRIGSIRIESDWIALDRNKTKLVTWSCGFCNKLLLAGPVDFLCPALLLGDLAQTLSSPL